MICKNRGTRSTTIVWIFLFLLGTARHALAAGPTFILKFSQSAAQDACREKNEPYDPEKGLSGRAYVFFSSSSDEPMRGPNWFSPEPFFAVDVQGIKPGDEIKIDDACEGFPTRLSEIPAQKYNVQALFDHDFYSQDHARGAGNLYSAARTIDLDPKADGTQSFELDQWVKVSPFPENDFIKEVAIRSELLSNFHHREVIDRCAVILPESYDKDPTRRYPCIYMIPGFSGSHYDALAYRRARPTAEAGEVEFIRVALSGQCKWGHHVYADSATNGPRGTALVQEMIPEIDKRFRTIAEPTARFVTGHSSGGWSSLWLQVAYPETFGGVWSTSPDPVDFRDYQQVNLYANPPLSLYVDEQQQRRPLARSNGQVVIWYDRFAKMDDVIGRGGQLRSFEAVFSPLDDAGQPRKLWDRTTGRIDPQVAQSWEAYDIRLKIERDWNSLEEKLRGKLHIITGSEDTFYLEGAVEQLQGTLQQLGSDAYVEVVPGKDHGSVLTAELRQKIRREMSEQFLKNHPGVGVSK